jgi:cytochrome c biogenesis protein CcdA/glutaredoxin
MTRRWIVFLLMVTTLLLPTLLGSEPAHAQEVESPPKATDPVSGEPVVGFFLFYSESCPHCHEVMENFLPKIYDKYRDQVQYQYFNISNDPDTYKTMLALGEKMGVPEAERGYVPTLYIGDQALIGSGEIPERLEGLIEQYLAQGGVDFPSLEDLPEVILPTPAPSVQVLVFLDPDHASFEELNAVMSSLYEQYAGQFQPYAIDVGSEENASTLRQINEALDVAQPPAGTPQVLIDLHMLVGMEAVAAELPDLVDHYLAQGGVDIPSWDDLMSGEPAETPSPPAERKPIYLAYFEEAGCQECARTTYDLQLIREQYPQLVVESFSMEEADNKALSEWLGEKYNVPMQRRLSTPMIFVGDDVLIGDEAVLDNLVAAVAKYEETGAERTWDDFDPEEGSQSIVERFKSFGVLTVLGAGLIDGLNPCAFATLVFFISYLAFSGRRGRDILFVGLAFAIGVFLTYLLVGVGLMRVIQSLSFFTSLGRWVYLVTALMCVILAAFTFRDYTKARQGKVTEMTLRLPRILQRRIHSVIRESAQMRAFVGVAFITGFLVSLIELACTGQVYLPTIVYVLSRPELAAQAFLYLVLYCLMFILPLIVVFVLAYLGTSSEQLGQFVNRHTAAIKLATGLVFTGLALWMTWTMAPLFGARDSWRWILMAAVVVVIALGSVVLWYVGKHKRQKAVPKRRRSRA